jgi:hypothetical protein
VRAEGHRGVHPYLAARDSPGLGSERFGGLDLSEDGPDPLVEAAPHLGDALSAGGAVDQPDAEVVFHIRSPRRSAGARRAAALPLQSSLRTS